MLSYLTASPKYCRLFFKKKNPLFYFFQCTFLFLEKSFLAALLQASFLVPSWRSSFEANPQTLSPSSTPRATFSFLHHNPKLSISYVGCFQLLFAIAWELSSWLWTCWVKTPSVLLYSPWKVLNIHQPTVHLPNVFINGGGETIKKQQPEKDPN